ncbi:RsmB/NOP family class I SAM-dependent RNA methyltransferase [Qipengyuania sp. DGS5-3]|uniref:RsmB/NOP family class I SAM-dependent RNA methyltransferase n=1 Tax=Qipengyuania sp. DGS5-3 TaxID=3349632 RepID=UPI0036D3B39F
MRPAARVQTAIELLDQIIVAAGSQGAPADRILAQWFKENRFAGSKDRRAIRELVYAAIRACGPVPKNGRAAMLRLAQMDESIAALFDGSQYGPRVLNPNEAAAEGGVAPPWLVEKLTKSEILGDDAAALLDRAPLDVRVNTLKADRAILTLEVESEPTAAPQGLRLLTGTQIEQSPEFREGKIEVQDTGSQLACLAVGAKPGETVVDLCAGAGGKTLALAAAMDNIGKLIACDTNRGRLSRLPARAERAGASNIEARLLNPGREMEAIEDIVGQADAVLVDAPCSGTGTWRRNPEARWRLTEAELAKTIDLQAYIVDLAVQLLRPGGRLIYVTCSLLDEEGTDQMRAACGRHHTLKPMRLVLPAGRERTGGVRLTPHHDGTDGFYIACAEKP